jgi:hypothetical protein
VGLGDVVAIISRNTTGPSERTLVDPKTGQNVVVRTGRNSFFFVHG